MTKAIFAIGAIAVFLFNVGPCKNTKTFQEDPEKLKEEQIVGRVQGHNPRVWEIQKILKDAHYYGGSIDGIIGRETREAIKEFQLDSGLTSTGQIDQATYTALIREKEKLASPQQVNSARTMEELPKSDSQAVSVSGEENKLERDSISYQTKKQSRTKQIQIALKNSGLYSGEIDGKMGPQTKKAIKAFQKSKDIEADGVVGRKTWKELQKYL